MSSSGLQEVMTLFLNLIVYFNRIVFHYAPIDPYNATQIQVEESSWTCC